MTILLTPFMSCGAKLPVYAVFAAAFFPNNQTLVMMGLYIIGILFGILSGFVMNKTFFKGAPAPFLMELPNYRFPSIKTVVLLMRDKAKDFIQRAFTVIFFATVAIWFLQSFDVRLNAVSNSADSMLAAIGQGLSAAFAPIGFSDWRVSTGLIAGFAAKEAVVSTLAVLTGASAAELGPSLHTLFSPLSAFSFLVFTLLYTPCAAAVSAARREWGDWKGALTVLLYQTGFAWIVAFLVYQAGQRLLGSL
jgi:ferrous iron transport protein B